MIFKDQRFKGKYEKLKLHREEIMFIIRKSLFNWQDFSPLLIRNYVDDLLRSSDYDVETDSFYDSITNESFSHERLANMTLNYIQENLDDFLKIEQARGIV